METIRVVVVDDHTLLRAGIRSLLGEMPGVECVGEAAEGAGALALVEALRPDVLLADIAMPGINGLELAERVARDLPPTRVIILSMHSDQEYVRRAIQAGARGYLLKDSDAEELGLALRAVSRGESYLSPAVARLMVPGDRRQVACEPAPGNGLTPRQQEVLRLIAEGNGTKGIARRLGISVKTVETHRTQLMERLDIHEVAGLVRYAIRVGLASSDR